MVDEDFVMVIAPTLELVYERERIRLTGSYGLAVSYYFKNPELNNLAHTASAGMNATLSQFTNLSVNDRFSYTKDSLEATITGIQRERASTTSNAISIVLGHAFTTRTTGSLTLSDTIYWYEGPTENTTRTDTASVGVGYAATDRTSLSMSYGITNIRYDSSEGVDNFTIHSLQAGFGYQLSPSVQLSLSAGATHTPSIDTSRTDWIASGTATKSFERTSVTLGYTRGMTDTSGLVNQLNISETYSLAVGHKVTETVDISLTGNYSQNHTTPESTLDLTSYDAGINGSWRPYSWMSVSAGYNHFEQESHGTIGSDFVRDSIFVNITATTSRRF
jgi:hypothetical protein